MRRASTQDIVLIVAEVSKFANWTRANKVKIE